MERFERLPLGKQASRLLFHEWSLLAQRRGESGMVRELAVFFKTPAGVAEHDLFKQFDMLERYLLPNR